MPTFDIVIRESRLE